MNLVVMKFGGTSVEDAAAIGRTAAIVAGRVASGCARRLRVPRATAPERWPLARACARAIATRPPAW